MTTWMALAITFGFLVAQHRRDLSASFEALPAKFLGAHWRGYLGYGTFLGVTIACQYRAPGLSADLNVFTAAIVANILLIAASLAWSQNPGLSVRRACQMVIVTGCAYVLGSRMSLADCAALIAACSAMLLMLGCVTEILVRKTTDYFSQLATTERYYRFFGISSPNWQALYCTLLVFASLILHRAGVLDAELYVPIVVFSMAIMALTGSRTTYWTVVAISLVSALIQFGYSGGVWGITEWLVIPVSAVFLAPLVALLRRFIHGDDRTSETSQPRAERSLPAQTLSVVSLGRSHETMKGANGRLALWKWAFRLAMHRPLLGYGYGGFWTEERTAEAGKAIRFRPKSAHSAYIETLLNTGLLGLPFLLALLIGAWQLVANAPFPQAAVIGALLAYVNIRGVFESDVVFPGFIGFSMMLFLSSLGKLGA